MADVLLGATVQVALGKLLSFATDQIGGVREFKKDLETLKETVEMISAIVDDAEVKQVKHLAVNLWLKRLEALAYRAEHVLDEVNYEMLRRRVEGKVSSFFSSHSRILFRLRIARKLKDINDEFESINKKATILGLQSQLGASVSNATIPLSNTGSSREKVSVVGQKVIGRGNDEKAIMHKLLSQSNELLTVVPIIGIGGLGKTTLAQTIYNSKQIVDHFGERIWVCVPKGIVPMSIFRFILESLPKNFDESLNGDNVTLDGVVRKIKEKLKDKQYLLVLDDVWSGHPESSWSEFLDSLRGISTSAGNYIIVTTREVPVASIFCARRDEHFPLKKLSNEHCLEIVKDRALIHEESIQYFEAIKENITEICQGVPLVARVIGGLLGRNPAKDWHSLLQKGISNMIGDEYYHIKQILQLSFDHLYSPSLKKCLAYCSLFQKDSTVEKKQLIQLWMAEGFLQSKTGYDDMEIGNECIKSLLGSSLLQEVINEEGECECVRMHDLVHDLAQSISNPLKDLKDVKEDDRYLVIDSFGEETKPLPKMRMLRTLFLGSGMCDNMLISSFKHLHVLKLSQVESQGLPSSIRKLIHLRYLGISHCCIRAIPESISELYSLQTIRIEECFDLEALPRGMTKLFNLRHLHYDSNTSLPPKIGHLSSLETLEYFVISEKNQIKELGCLKNLRGKLTIYNLDGVCSKEEAQQAGLNKKPMNNLSFNWSGEDVNHEEVLEGLQPHPHLQKLNIHAFLGNQFPSWFMNMVVCLDQNPNLSQRLDRLASLSVESCKRCKQLPSLGHLPALKYLKLKMLDNISCIEPSFYSIDVHSESSDISKGQVPRKIFPALKHFVVESMKNLKEWMNYQTTNSEVLEMFPNLEKVNIDDCPQLSHAPIHYFQSLKHLRIHKTNLDGIFSAVEEHKISYRSPISASRQGGIPSSLESLEVCYCLNLSEIPEYLYELQSLRNLDIEYCTNLKSLPIPTGQQRLTSLQDLVIQGCHGLTSLPHELLNSCPYLTSLSISCCDGLTSLQSDLLNSCVSLQHLYIHSLRNLESFPFDLQQSPSLSSLSLYQLPKLMTAPKLVPFCSYGSKLSDLTIGGFSNFVEVDWSVLSSLSLHRLELISWPNLVSLPDQLQHLTALRGLWLFQLGQIEALPDWIANLVSLETLYIDRCEKLCNLPSVAAMRSLTKLSYLFIANCPLLKERCTQRSSPNSEWAKISHIPNIWMHHERL